MSGKKKQRQQAAEDTSKAAAQVEQTKANELHGELQQRRDLVGDGLSDTLKTTREGATNLRETGGLDPTKVAPIQSGYNDLAMTGGYTPAERTSFLRRATAPVSAMFSRVRDEMGRRSVVSGNTGGYDAGNRRLLRDQAITGAETSQNANLALNEDVRKGKVTGLEGQKSLLGLEQTGKIAGQDALQRYTQLGVSALSDIDINELRNRAQTGQMSQADAQLLSQLAAQDKTLFEKIMQGVSVAAGAVSGVAGAMK